MNLRELLNRVAVCGNENRRNAITSILNELGVNYRVSDGQAKNIIVTYNNSNSKIVVGAHYDAALQNAQAANDNAAACAILLKLIETLKETTNSYEFVFFDLEERGFVGSRQYLSTTDNRTIKAFINLDMCGLGNNLCLMSHGYTEVLRQEPFNSLINNAEYRFRLLPPGDQYSFMERNIPTIFIINSTDNDLPVYREYERTQRMYCLFNTDFNQTMHKPNDTVDTCNDEGMNKIFNHLITYLH